MIHKDGGDNEWRRAAKMRDDEFTRNVDEFPKREMCGVERKSVRVKIRTGHVM